jgi:hypothetical protein
MDEGLRSSKTLEDDRRLGQHTHTSSMKGGLILHTKAHEKPTVPEDKRLVPVQAWTSQPAEGCKRTFKDLFKNKHVTGRVSANMQAHESDRPGDFISSKKGQAETAARQIQLNPPNREAKVLLQPKSNSQLARTHRPTLALGQAPLKDSITVISRLLSTATQTRNAELTRSAAVPRFVRSPDPKQNPKPPSVWQRLS